MRNKRNYYFLLCIHFILFTSNLSFSQNNSPNNNGRPKLFIDCSRCDVDFIRTEIQFVNYVYDRKNADIHLLITREYTGSGGRKYTLSFLGQNLFSHKNDTLTFNTQNDGTEDEIRLALVKYIKIGLMRYVAELPIADQILISFRAKKKLEEVKDKWNYWVFRSSLDGYFSGEESRNSLSVYGRFSANRITPDWKLSFSAYTNHSERNFNDDGEKISSYSRRQRLRGLVVKSLSDHWSVGVDGSIYSSTYLNYKNSIRANPAIEYNYFPYTESTRRELRFLYEIGYGYRWYNEETIYDKIEEGLFEQALSMVLELRQPWGNVEMVLSGSHYFHDIKKNRLEIFSELSLRLFKGFSFEIDGSFSMIHDQLSLAKRDISTEELLLQRTQLETQYEYRGSIGFSYTFGAIYNNVVNPRFGNQF